MKLKLSIIIPVYNLENYIAETLDSCLNQDMNKEEYEIICIDDGSKDRSAEIINKYKQKYSNIVLFQKQNGGVSSARNKGLELATGEYIWFVDGDDLIAPNCLNFLYKSVKINDSDLIMFKMKHFKHNPAFDNIENSQVRYCSNEDKKYDFMSIKNGGGVWIFLFKNDLLHRHNLLFNEEIKYSEDVLYSFEAIMLSFNCARTDTVYYYYRQREGSAMHSNKIDLHIESMKKLAITYNDLSKLKGNNSVKNILINKRDCAVKALLFSIMMSGNISLAKSELKDLKEMNFYPYPLQKSSLKGNKSYKQLIINYISFLFPNEFYFIMCVKLFSLKNKLKNLLFRKSKMH